MGKPITDLSSVTTVGLDLAKHVFHVHGVDACGRAIVSKALRRKDVLVFFAQVPRALSGRKRVVRCLASAPVRQNSWVE
jgi:transposase